MTVTWKLWSFDVWGNATDGWEVNDRSCREREFEIPAADPNAPTPSEVATILEDEPETDTPDDESADDAESTEPEEGDYTLSPCGSLGSQTRVCQYGKTLGEFVPVGDSSADAMALAFIRCHADREQFWPNAWIISDHGNAHLTTY